MSEFKIGDRVKYLGVPYQGLPVGSEGTIVGFADGASGARYAHVDLDGRDDGHWDFIVNGIGMGYVGPEIEKVES